MVNVSSNFSNGKKYVHAGWKHIYICKLLSKGNGNHKPKYEIIFSDNVSEQIKVNKYFIMNYQEIDKCKIKKN